MREAARSQAGAHIEILFAAVFGLGFLAHVVRGHPVVGVQAAGVTPLVQRVEACLGVVACFVRIGVPVVTGWVGGG